MNAVIIHDDWKAGVRACALLKRAANRAEPADPCNIRLWTLDRLALPSTSDTALGQAVGAHLIVVAVRGQVGSPGALLDWLETWAGRREIEDAALAVYQSGQNDTLSPTAAGEVSAFARRHGLSLILGQTDLSGETSATSGFAGLERDGVAGLAFCRTTATPVGDSYRGFGINE